LDYEPHVEPARDRTRHPNVSLRTGSGARKASGSFYTPQSIAGYLIRETIGPLVRGATPDQILRLRVLDPAMGSGAFLVAASARQNARPTQTPSASRSRAATCLRQQLAAGALRSGGGSE